jgi:hypothetical protein
MVAVYLFCGEVNWSIRQSTKSVWYEECEDVDLLPSEQKPKISRTI